MVPTDEKDMSKDEIQGEDQSPPSDPGPARSPIKPGRLIRFKNWLKNPANGALFLWLLFVLAGLIMLLLVAAGALNGAIPSRIRRKKWMEVIKQILNALFTLMCLYNHPNLFHHLVLLCRWRPGDRVELRKVYCKGGAGRPHERAHMMLVVLLINITFVTQYVACGLYWGYTRTTRPDWAADVCVAIGIAAPVTAAVYAAKSPLGRRIDAEPQVDQELQQPVAARHGRRIAVTEPEWIGGLLDCRDDPAVDCRAIFCTFCVFGWNMERLGLGNMYVHIFTFGLFCVAPFLVFGAAALKIDNDAVAIGVGIFGFVLSVFGLFYGGFWRSKMRERFRLPGNPFCCGYPSVTDWAQWLFCWSCSLAQEVRTGNFYDIEDGGFYWPAAKDEDGRPVQPREDESALLYRLSLDSDLRGYSSPPKTRPHDPPGHTSSSQVHAMTPPLSSEIQRQYD